MSHHNRDTPIALVLVLSLMACGQEAAVEQLTWPQWRGADGSGVSTEAPLPVSWGVESPQVRWSVEVPGRGNSSPIVAGGRVFLTTALEPRDEIDEPGVWRMALAVDLETGETLWEQKIARLPKGQRYRKSSFAVPTSATDGKTLFVYFGAMVAALDVATGKVEWEREMEANHFAYTVYGTSSSPVLTRDAVIVVQDQEAKNLDGGWLVALGKDSGEELWRVEWSNSCCSYSTPLVVDRGSGTEIIFVHSGRVASYDAATGEILWSREVPISQMVSSPVLDGNLLGVSGGAHNVRHTSFFELQGSGRDTRLELLWETPKYSPHTSSPVVYKGLFFTVTDNGVVSCFNARTGRQYWKNRIGSSFRASLLAGDDKLYALSSSGTTAVIQADKKFRLLAENELGDRGNNASPAVADGCLLIRTRTRLHCIETGEVESDPVAAED